MISYAEVLLFVCRVAKLPVALHSVDGHGRNLCLCHHHQTFASLKYFFCKMAFVPLFTLVSPLKINHNEQDDYHHTEQHSNISSTLRQWCILKHKSVQLETAVRTEEGEKCSVFTLNISLTPLFS